MLKIGLIIVLKVLLLLYKTLSMLLKIDMVIKIACLVPLKLYNRMKVIL